MGWDGDGDGNGVGWDRMGWRGSVVDFSKCQLNSRRDSVMITGSPPLNTHALSTRSVHWNLALAPLHARGKKDTSFSLHLLENNKLNK